jgi:hypothetical protein
MYQAFPSIGFLVVAAEADGLSCGGPWHAVNEEEALPVGYRPTP